MLIEELFASGRWLPYLFAFLIGISTLIYAVLDGYDLGVGMLSPFVSKNEREKMISSIAPFWDANETWLVLGSGLILVAFPAAHGIIFGYFYIPIAIMLFGLIYRGVSFDFRKKAPPHHQPFWDASFFLGSLFTALSQGYMLGRFIMGFGEDLYSYLFAVFFMGLVCSAYLMMGSNWLLMKTEGELQKRAIKWAQVSIVWMLLMAISSSLVAPLINVRIYERMFFFPEVAILVAFPLVSLILLVFMIALLRQMPLPGDKLTWVPFLIGVVISVLGFQGLAYSFYPYIIPGKMLITEASAAPESLMIILIGVAIIFPVLIVYTAFSYWVFRGKATDVTYE